MNGRAYHTTLDAAKPVARDRSFHGPVKYGLSPQEFALNTDYVPPFSLLATEMLLAHVARCQQFVTGRLLDVGCGYKPFGPMLRDRVTSHLGLDVPFSVHKDWHVDVHGTAEHIPFRDNSFDTVLCTELLEHVPDPHLTMRELRRVLRSGGHIILSVPFMYRIHEPPHDYCRFTVFGVCKLLQDQGFELQHLGVRGGHAAVLIDIWAKLAYGLVARLRSRLRPTPALLWGIANWSLVTAPQKLYLLLTSPRTHASSALGEQKEPASMTLGYVVAARLQK